MALTCVVQEQALTTKYIIYKVDNISERGKCRFCSRHGVTVRYINLHYMSLVHTEFKLQRSNFWTLCNKCGLDIAKHVPNKTSKIIIVRDFKI